MIHFITCLIGHGIACRKLSHLLLNAFLLTSASPSDSMAEQRIRSTFNGRPPATREELLWSSELRASISLSQVPYGSNPLERSLVAAAELSSGSSLLLAPAVAPTPAADAQPTDGAERGKAPPSDALVLPRNCTACLPKGGSTC